MQVVHQLVTELVGQLRATHDLKRDKKVHEEHLYANGRLETCWSCKGNIDTTDHDSYVCEEVFVISVFGMF